MGVKVENIEIRFIEFLLIVTKLDTAVTPMKINVIMI